MGKYILIIGKDFIEVSNYMNKNHGVVSEMLPVPVKWQLKLHLWAMD